MQITIVSSYNAGVRDLRRYTDELRSWSECRNDIWGQLPEAEGVEKEIRSSECFWEGTELTCLNS